MSNTPDIHIFAHGTEDNPREHRIATLSNDLPEACKIQEMKLKQKINGGETLTFSVPAHHPEAGFVMRGYWAVFKDLDGSFRAFVIQEETERHNQGEMVREACCEELAVVELNDEIVEDVRPRNTNVRDALNRLLEDSQWVAGTVDDLGTGSANFYYENRMSGIKKIIEEWGGEIRFRVDIEANNTITGRYVDVLAQRGRRTGKRFEYSKDLTSVERITDMKPIKTALYGRGKGEETDSGGYGRRLTFADVEWSEGDGDPVDKPKGQEWVGDPDALATWGHVNPDGTRRHRFGVYTNEQQEDAAQLLQETWEELKRQRQPEITYKMDVLDLEQVNAGEYSHEAVRLGDTVAVIDRNFAWDVQIEARVSEIERDFIAPENTRITLGNVLKDITGVVREIQDRVEEKIGRDDPIGWLRGIIDAARSEFHSQNGYVYITDEDGILITNRPRDNIDNPPDQAMQLKHGGLAIAGSRNPDGTFNWETFVLGDQVIADRINTGRIRTDNVTVGDDSGMVRISGGNVVIKGGGLEVYSTPDASDNGVMIRGNKISTNFIKNGDFDNQPSGDEAIDWRYMGTAHYNSSGRRIDIDVSPDMGPQHGVVQEFPVFNERATFQALFRCNITRGSATNRVRFYWFFYDSETGGRFDELEYVEELALYQDWHLLTRTIDFPPGTVRARLYVQAWTDGQTMDDGFEIHWVRGYYDEMVRQDQLLEYPRDLHSVQAAPEIQQFSIFITLTKDLGTETYSAGNMYFPRVFSDPGSLGRIAVVLTGVDGWSPYYNYGAYNISRSGFELKIKPRGTALSAGTELSLNGIAYRVGYLGSTGGSI
ncbi:phage tail protein [Paludifilum halophilum]|uniref:phage tail protein n=1 Tax=Paludifilum halophilum TaxID=1642702 RepID=UPI00146ACE51|nr:phage tail protein [Paludifilum halophilum]